MPLTLPAVRAGIIVFEDVAGWLPRIGLPGLAFDVVAMTPASVVSATQIVQATVSSSPGVLDATRERVALALRGARARTGMSEERTVAVLNERGVEISVPVLRRAERTGELDFALASCLADIYGTTTDCLAGRRPDRLQASSLGFMRR
jgi:hypothetical protein